MSALKISSSCSCSKGALEHHRLAIVPGQMAGQMPVVVVVPGGEFAVVLEEEGASLNHYCSEPAKGSQSYLQNGHLRYSPFYLYTIIVYDPPSD